MTRWLAIIGTWLVSGLSLLLIVLVSPWWLFLTVPSLLVALVGSYDLVQSKHSVLRNYPVLGHARFLLESIRPELQQYFIERNTSGTPYDRNTRRTVYQRAKDIKTVEPFGTELDVNAPGYEFVQHSMVAQPAPQETPRVRIGGPDCTQPYEMAMLNVSAMSFGALSANAILALNGGAARGGFAHDSGEGGLSPYHLKPGGDLIWELAACSPQCRGYRGVLVTMCPVGRESITPQGMNTLRRRVSGGSATSAAWSPGVCVCGLQVSAHLEQALHLTDVPDILV